MNKVLIIFFSVFCIFWMYLTPGPFDNFSIRVFITSLIIQLISIYSIFSKVNQPYSLHKIFFLFSLFFFGISPLLQFYSGTTLFGARSIKENEYFYINLLLILIIVIYKFSYSFFYKREVEKKRVKFIYKLEISNKLNLIQTILILLISFISFLLVFRTNNNSILSMLFRGGELKESIKISGTASIIIFSVFQPLSMMCLLYYISSKSKNTLVYILLFVSAIITCSPLGMARFSAAAMYIPLLILIFPPIRKKNIFSITFILGFLIVFPILNNFRFFNGDFGQIGLNFDMFTTGHFDSYQNLTLIVSDNIITWGKQLLGVIFFWIPRIVWPNKPIGSGAHLAEEQGFVFSNVSCNYFAEGYINFGFIGIFIFVILLAFVTAKLDKMYWSFSVNYKNNYFNVIYYVLLGMLFFILRGDLLSSFAFTIGFLISIWLVHKIAGIRIKRI